MIFSRAFHSTLREFRWEKKRQKTRIRSRFTLLQWKLSKREIPRKLHVGCGKRRVPGWLNVDIQNSEFDLDLGYGKLPFPDSHFSAVASQHVIEHLELERELIPLLYELNRCMVPGAEIWLSCPSMYKVCKSYLEDGGVGLLQDRISRFPNWSLKGLPPSHIVNKLFHQHGQHKNLFDFPLLTAVLEKTGFVDVKEVDERAFLNRFPEFPERNDGFQSIYVSALVPPPSGS